MTRRRRDEERGVQSEVRTKASKRDVLPAFYQTMFTAIPICFSRLLKEIATLEGLKKAIKNKDSIVTKHLNDVYKRSLRILTAHDRFDNLFFTPDKKSKSFGVKMRTDMESLFDAQETIYLLLHDREMEASLGEEKGAMMLYYRRLIALHVGIKSLFVKDRLIDCQGELISKNIWVDERDDKRGDVRGSNIFTMLRSIIDLTDFYDFDKNLDLLDILFDERPKSETREDKKFIFNFVKDILSKLCFKNDRNYLLDCCISTSSNQDRDSKTRGVNFTKLIKNTLKNIDNQEDRKELIKDLLKQKCRIGRDDKNAIEIAILNDSSEIMEEIFGIIELIDAKKDAKESRRRLLGEILKDSAFVDSKILCEQFFRSISEGFLEKNEKTESLVKSLVLRENYKGFCALDLADLNIEEHVKTTFGEKFLDKIKEEHLRPKKDRLTSRKLADETPSTSASDPTIPSKKSRATEI